MAGAAWKAVLKGGGGSSQTNEQQPPSQPEQSKEA
jgi:hypothetical protein